MIWNNQKRQEKVVPGDHQTTAQEENQTEATSTSKASMRTGCYDNAPGGGDTNGSASSRVVPVMRAVYRRIRSHARARTTSIRVDFWGQTSAAPARIFRRAARDGGDLAVGRVYPR